MRLPKTVYKYRERSLNLWNKNLNKREKEISLRNFVLQRYFKDFRAELEHLKNVQAVMITF